MRDSAGDANCEDDRATQRHHKGATRGDVMRGSRGGALERNNAGLRRYGKGPCKVKQIPKIQIKTG